MNNKASANYVAGTAVDTDGFGFKTELGNTVGVGFQAGQVAAVMRTHIVVFVRFAGRVEMAARAQAVTAGAVAFFVNMKTVLRVGLKAAYLTADPDDGSNLIEAD